MSSKFLVFLTLFLFGVLTCLFLVPGYSQETTTTPLPAQTLASTSGLVFTGNFESGTLTGWDRETCCRYSAQTKTSPIRAGKYAARFELRKTDPDVSSSKRSELVLDTVPTNSERWYGFSVMLPADWKADTSFEIVTQWHSIPDFDLKEDWRTPALYLSVRDNIWRITNRWDPKAVTLNNNPTPEGGIATLWQGPYRKGAWTDWVVHVKWSYQTDGLLQVWKDGVLVVDKKGPNTYNDRQGPYMKMGIYKPDWKFSPQKSTTSTRILYFDEVRIGDRTASYSAVAPPRKTS